MSFNKPPYIFLSTQVIIIIIINIIRAAVYCSASGISKVYITLYVNIKR